MKKAKSVCLLVLCAMIWGTSFVAQVSSRGLSPFTYNAIKYLIGALSLVPVFLIFERQKTEKSQLIKTIKGGIVSGLFLCLASNLQQLGIYYGTQAGKAGFLTGLYTVIVPFLALIIFKKKTTVLTWIGAFVAVAGLYMLCMTNTKGFDFRFNDLLVVIGALFWASHIVSVDYFTDKGVSALRYSFVQFAVCGILTFIIALIFEDMNMTDILATKVEILYGGIMSVGVAFTLQILGQRNVEPALSAIVLSTESVFSVIGGAIILKERFAFPYGYLGCVLIFAAIIMSQITPKRIITQKVKRCNSNEK